MYSAVRDLFRGRVHPGSNGLLPSWSMELVQPGQRLACRLQGLEDPWFGNQFVSLEHAPTWRQIRILNTLKMESNSLLWTLGIEAL